MLDNQNVFQESAAGSGEEISGNASIAQVLATVTTLFLSFSC